MVSKKPSYEELEQRIRELEKKISAAQLEAALRESRDLFKKAFMSQRDAVFILNADTPPIIMDCNPAGEMMFGYCRQEMVGKDTEFLHVSKEAPAEFQKKLRQTIAQQGFLYLKDFVMKRKDGTPFPGDHTVVPLNNEKGELTGWVSVIRDATERKQLEETVRESNEHYRLLADNVSDVIFMRDLNFRFTYISPSVEKMTGYSVEEAMSLTMEEAYTPRSIKVAMEAFSEELSREREDQSDPARVRTIEMEGYRKDGSTMWAEAKMRFLRDPNGHPTGFLGISRDITERRRAEEALRISEERYRSLVEDMPALVCRFLPDGTLTFVNKSYCDYFGCKREYLIGQNFFQFMPSEERESVSAHFTSLTKERPMVTYEHQVIAPDGTPRWQQWTDRALFDGNGHLKEYQSLGLDMTERRQAEDALLESDVRFKKLSSHVPGMIYQFMKKPDGSYCMPFTTEAIRDIFGCSPQDVREDFSPIAKAICPEDLAKVIDSIESSAARMTVWECEYRVQTPGRPVRWMFGRSTPEKMADGSIIWYGFNTEITERKQMEEALHEKDAIFSAFLEHSPIFVFFKDKDIRPIHLSRNYEQLLGMPLDQVIGKTMDELFPPDLAKSIIADDKRVLFEGQRINVVEDLDGRIYETIKFPVLKDGAPFILAGFTMDITERKRAEEALRESERRYKQIFNYAPAGIYELDFQTQRFVAVNDVMCQYTGYTKEEFLTMSPYDILSEDGKTLYAERVRKLMAGENISETVEYKIMTKGGQPLWVALNISPVYDKGKVRGVTVVVHNVTERRMVEQRLRESEKRLRALSAELMEAQENERIRISRELHDELGQSLAILKHRVRSIGKKLTACQAQLAQDSETTVDLVDDIIEKVRQISRDLNPSILEDAGLCAALRSLADNFTQEYRIPTSLQLDDIDPLFTKETARILYRIFQEALTNIAKHADASHVAVQIRNDSQYVYFAIHDDGKGFDTNEARAREKNRRGLGLPLMEERSNSLGGTLEIRSRERDKGTSILLTVPIEKRGNE